MPLTAFEGKEPRVHPSAFLADGVQIIGDVEIARDASVWFNSVIRGDINRIVIGERTNVQDSCILHVTHEYPVVIGSDVTLGHRVIAHGCTIGDGALIGMGAVLLDNARIGPHALVAAGAVVLENFVVPEGALAAGVPARIIRQLKEEERSALIESAQHYVEYARRYCQ